MTDLNIFCECFALWRTYFERNQRALRNWISLFFFWKLSQSGIKSKAEFLSQPSPGHTHTHLHGCRQTPSQWLYFYSECVSFECHVQYKSPFCIRLCRSSSLNTQGTWDNLNYDMIHELWMRIATASQVFLLSSLSTVTLRSKKPSGRRSRMSPPSQSPSLPLRRQHSSFRCPGSKMHARRPPSDSSRHRWRYCSYKSGCGRSERSCV